MKHFFRSLFETIIISLIFFSVHTGFAQKSTLMTFTSYKGASTKDWVADSCYATLDENKTLTITGLFASGRTDIPYQAMVITIRNFSTLSSTIVYNLSDAYFEDIYSVNGKPTRVKTTMVASIAQSYVKEYDAEKSLLKGTFFFDMTSHPPSGADFVTQVTVGKFEAAIAPGITLDVSPTKDTKTNAGKKANFKLYAKNLFDLPIPNADVYVSDEIGKLVETKVGTTTSAGEYVYTVDIPAKTTVNKYKVSFYIKLPTNSKIKSNVVERIIDVSGRYWVFSCANSTVMTLDAGEGNEFKSDDPLPTITAKGNILVNDILTLKGTVTVDPRQGFERITGKYSMYIDGVDIAGTKEQLSFGDDIGLSLNCAGFLKWDTPGIIKKKIGGVEFSLDELSFANLDFAKAVKIKVSAQWNNLNKDNCTTNSNQPENSSITGGITIANEELAGYKIEGFEASISNFSTNLIPGFCIDNAGFSYDGPTDSWKVSTVVEYKPPSAKPKFLEGKAKASVTFTNGRFDAFSLEGKAKPGIPVPDLPFAWVGLKLAASGWSRINTERGRSLELSGFFLSDDALVKMKIPWLAKLLGDESAVELELNGKIETSGPKITANLIGRMFAVKDISVTQKWQVVSTGSCGIDFSNGIEVGTFDNSLKALHFGTDDYVLTIGSGYKSVLQLKSDDIAYYANTGNAIFRIPDVASDPPNSVAWGSFLKLITYLKGLKVLPRTIGTASGSMMLSYQQGLEFNGMVDVTTSGIPILSSYGSLSIKTGIKDGGCYMKFGGAFPSLFSSSQKRRFGDGILSNSKNNDFIQASALDTFEVTSNMKRSFIMMSSTGHLSASTLISPKGEKITGTKPDSSIILFASDDGTFAQWSLINPETGNWVLQFTNPSPNDSVYFFSLNKDRSFDITAVQNGQNVNVSWDGNNYQQDDYIDIFLDSKNNNYAGKYMGRANASAGNFVISLTDSLPDCSYYVYATRIASGTSPITKYVTGNFSVSKTGLSGPTNIKLVSDKFGNCVLTFTYSNDANVARYAVYANNPAGADSLISWCYKNENTITFDCDTSILKDLYVVALNSDFQKGCPVIPQSITVDVPENQLSGLGDSQDFGIFPNPAANYTQIRFNIRDNGIIKLYVADLLGNKLVTLADGYYELGLFKTEMDTNLMNTGTYLVKLITNNKVYSKMLVILK